MSLFKTEMRRFGKRRLIRYTVLLGMLVLAAVAAFTFVSNQPIGPEQLAAAERAADENYRENVRWAEEARRDCERAHASGDEEVEEHFPPDCDVIQPQPREEIQTEWFLPPTFLFRDEFPIMITTFAAVLALVGFVVGASFVGAEWSSGGMMNLLLWRPRRLRVLYTKLAVLLTGLAGITLVAALLWLAAFWAIGTYRGSMDGMTAGTWQSFGLTGLRGLVLVLVAGLIGFALASAGRHTATALGVVLGVAMVGQFGLGVALTIAQAKFMEAWLLPTYLWAWMYRKIELVNYRSCEMSPGGMCEPETMEIVWQHAGILFAVVSVLLLAVATWSMRNRDIT
ncbi:MAG TPA: ABC transporter permease subunit [Micromonosporaceae bacterium]